MKLSVYSLKKVLFAGNASLLNCNTEAGEITVLDNHEPYIGMLKTGVMKVVETGPQLDGSPSAKSNGASHFFEIKSGFLEVRQGNEVRCMVE